MLDEVCPKTIFKLFLAIFFCKPYIFLTLENKISHRVDNLTFDCSNNFSCLFSISS